MNRSSSPISSPKTTPSAAHCARSLAIPKRYRAWVEDWVFATGHEGYLARLGASRLEQLQSEALSPVPVEPKDWSETPSPEERAAVLAMQIAERNAIDGEAQHPINAILP